MSASVNGGYATSPIEFIKDNNCCVEAKGNADESFLGVQNSPYIPTPHQNDVLTGYQAKLRYEVEKKKLDLQYQNASYHQRMKFEEELRALNIHYQNYLKMLSATVYKDSAGDIIFSILDSGKHSLTSTALLNISDYTTRIYVSYYPVELKALEVSWSETGKNFIVFPYSKEGIDPNVFLKRLKKNGVLLSVSGRTEKQAANALLAYSFMNAESVEISRNRGWNKMGDGTWHYAKKNEITMMEVFRDGGVQ